MTAFGERRGQEETDAADTAVPVDDQITEQPDAAIDDDPAVNQPQPSGRTGSRARVLVYAVLPGLILVLALLAGFFKYQLTTSESDRGAAESLQAAKDSTIALLSYQPANVEQQMAAARDRTTGQFRDSYTQLTNDVVIPGAKQQQISTVVTIPAASSVSVNGGHAVALLFVNQSTTIGKSAPTMSVSSVRVTMDEVDDRWLISGFDPI